MINTIYILRNKCNDKVYVGQTWQTLETRWNRGHGYIGSHKIHNAIKKYGKENFYYDVVAYCETQTAADCCETFFIKRLDSIEKGYNICLGGVKGVMTGRKHKSESIEKMSKSHKGSTAHLGFIHSEETKKNISEMTLKQFEEKGHPFEGKHHSEETKKTLSEQRKEQRLSPKTEFKKGMVPWNKGKKYKNKKTRELIDGGKVYSDKKE